jgi:hypothetical protein
MSGRAEHTDKVKHHGTWHVQLCGSKTWYIRPDPAAPEWDGVRCAFSTMDSAVLGLGSSDCGCCTVRVFRQGFTLEDTHWFPRLPT